jgi:uncharacterized membrane protein YozB (DUF420 family)
MARHIVLSIIGIVMGLVSIIGAIGKNRYLNETILSIANSQKKRSTKDMIRYTRLIWLIGGVIFVLFFLFYLIIAIYTKGEMLYLVDI